VAGCYVVDGVLKRDGQVRVVRDGAIIYHIEAQLAEALQDDASEVRTGSSAAQAIANFNDVKVGDILECFQVMKLSAADAAAQSSAPASRR